jgi:hypothetical protein
VAKVLFGTTHPMTTADRALAAFRLDEDTPSAHDGWRPVEGTHLVAVVRAGAIFHVGVLSSGTPISG